MFSLTGIFQTHISHLLVLTTPVEVLLLGVTFMHPCGNSEYHYWYYKLETPQMPGRNHHSQFQLHYVQFIHS